MKSLVALMFLFPVVSFAQAQKVDCVGNNGQLKISYSSTSFAGIPLLSFTDSELALGIRVDAQFKGDEVRRSFSPAGIQVTGTAKQGDGSKAYVTLYLTGKRAAEKRPQVSFESLVVTRNFWHLAADLSDSDMPEWRATNVSCSAQYMVP